MANKGNYGHDCRRLLQSFVANPCQSVNLVKSNYETAYEETEGRSITVDDISAIIKVMNEKLQKDTNFVIRQRKCEVTGDKFYVLINTSDVGSTKPRSPYSEHEQALFSKILEEILRSTDGCVSSMSLLNMGSSLNPVMTQTSVEKTLEKFVWDHWFVNKDGSVYIGARSALGLETSLPETFESMKCMLCKKALYHGVQCSKCSKHCHKPCLEHYFMLRKGTRVCPGCHADWPAEPSDADSD